MPPSTHRPPPLGWTTGTLVFALAGACAQPSQMSEAGEGDPPDADVLEGGSGGDCMDAACPDGTLPDSTVPLADGSAEGGDGSPGGGACVDDCSGHGECIDGGTCRCSEGYTGVACGQCAAGYQAASGGTACVPSLCSSSVCAAGELCVKSTGVCCRGVCTQGQTECAAGSLRRCVVTTEEGCGQWTPWEVCDNGCADGRVCASGVSGVTAQQWGGSGNDSAIGVTIGLQGEPIVVGAITDSLDGQSVTGASDYYATARPSRGGSTLTWSRVWGGTASEEAVAARVAPDGSLYVLGNRTLRPEVWKWNAQAEVDWTFRGRPLGGLDNSGYDFGLTETGRIVVGGGTDDQLVETEPDHYDAYVIEVTPDGEEGWSDQWTPAAGVSIVWGVAVDGEGAAYLVGQVPVGSAVHAFARKLDSAGQEEWTTTLGTAADARAYGVSLDIAGNVLISGATGGTLPGATGTGMGFWGRLDPDDGSVLDLEQFSPVVVDRVRIVGVSDGFYLSGEVSGELVAGQQGGNRDAFAQRRDLDDGVVWTRQYGTSMRENVWGLAVASDGTAYVVGETSGTFPGFTHGGGNYDAFMLTLDP